MSKNIRTNIKKSSVILKEEGNRPERQIFYRGYAIPFDNYMDAICLSTVWSVDIDKPFKSAMLMPHDGSNAKQGRTGGFDSADAVGDLVKTIAGKSTGTEYARYWHGYMLWLKPLLLIMDLTAIRITLTIILAILFILLMGSLIKDGYKIEAAIIAISLICGEYFYMGTSLQGVSVFLVMMIMSLILWHSKKENTGYIFFITGSLIAFVDLLTVPLLGLILPLTIYQIKEKDTIKTFIKNSFIWILGFGITWSAKWILTDLFFKRNIIKTALFQIIWRTHGYGEINYKTTIALCFTVMRTFLVPIIFILLILLIVYRKRITKKRIKENVTYLLIAISPFVWYAVLKTHSYYHYYFTYRNLVAFLIGILLFVKMLTERSKKDAIK